MTYTTDAAALDAATALDAVVRKTGHKGFAVLTDDDGKTFEIHPIGGAKGELCEEPRKVGEPNDPRGEHEGRGGENSVPQMAGPEWERAKARSHAHGKRQMAADAAHLSAAAKRFTNDQYSRNEAIAAQRKAAAKRLWG